MEAREEAGSDVGGKTRKRVWVFVAPSSGSQARLSLKTINNNSLYQSNVVVQVSVISYYKYILYLYARLQLH